MGTGTGTGRDGTRKGCNTNTVGGLSEGSFSTGTFPPLFGSSSILLLLRAWKTSWMCMHYSLVIPEPWWSHGFTTISHRTQEIRIRTQGTLEGQEAVRAALKRCGKLDQGLIKTSREVGLQKGQRESRSWESLDDQENSRESPGNTTFQNTSNCPTCLKNTWTTRNHFTQTSDVIKAFRQ